MCRVSSLSVTNASEPAETPRGARWPLCESHKCRELSVRPGRQDRQASHQNDKPTHRAGRREGRGPVPGRAEGSCRLRWPGGRVVRAPGPVRGLAGGRPSRKTRVLPAKDRELSNVPAVALACRGPQGADAGGENEGRGRTESGRSAERPVTFPSRHGNRPLRATSQVS